MPSTVAVLLDDHLEFFDLRKDGIPRLPAPYGLELQMSRTTCSMVVDDCPQRLSIALRRIAALIADPATPNGGAWPITGGRPTQRSSRMTKLLLTGHHDGAVRFWDMAGELPSPLAPCPLSLVEALFSRKAFLTGFVVSSPTLKRHWGSS